MTLVAGGALGLLAAGPASAQCDLRHHGRLGLAERTHYVEAKKRFWTAVRAFNDMKSIPIEQSPFWQELDKNVAIYDFDAGNQIVASGREGSVYYLYNLPTAHFDPIPGTVCFHLNSNPQKVTGSAYWTGNAGAGTEKISFTWILNEHRVLSMKGRVLPPAA